MLSLGTGTLSTFVKDEIAALTDPESKLARRIFPKEESQESTKDKNKGKNKNKETTKEASKTQEADQSETIAEASKENT